MSEINYLRGPIKVIRDPLWWQKEGLSYTSSGYGSKIPTEWVTYINNRKHRIYIVIYSNSGSLYVLINKRKYYIYEHDIVR